MDEEKQTEETSAPKLPSLVELLKSNSTNVMGVFACYVFGIVIGYGWPDMVSPAFISNLETVNKTLMEEYRGRPVAMALYSFSNSFIALYLAMVMGILACVPPVYFLLSEGILTGTFAARSGATLAGSLVPDVPGLLELFASSVAMGWGVKIGFSLFRPPRLAKLRLAFVEGHRVFLSLVFLLLFAANAFRMAQTLLE